MKKITFLAALVAFSFTAFSQITLEHTFGEMHFVRPFNTQNGLKYLVLKETIDYDNDEIVSSKLEIYNHSFVLEKSIGVFEDTRFEVDWYYGNSLIFLPSHKLFNQDDKIQILVYARIGGSDSGSWSLFVINEDGEIEFDFGSVEPLRIFTDDNVVKLLVGSNNYSNGYDFKVYSLPGDAAVATTEVLNNTKMMGYPNPARNHINLSNVLQDGEQGLLEVFSSNGARVMQQTVVGGNDDIQIDISGLRGGTYIYRINRHSGKFIKF